MMRDRIILCAVIIFLAPLFASTQTASSVLINELLYDPAGTDSGNEWVELYNSGDTEINLKGWKLEWGGTTIDANSFTFPSSSPEPVIGAHQFVLMADNGSLTPYTKASSKAFTNASGRTDGIRLKNDQGEVVDFLLYGSPNTNNLPDKSGQPGTEFAGKVSSEGSSLARMPDGLADLGNSKDFVSCSNPTPGASNNCPSPTPAPTPTPTPTSTPKPTATPTATPSPTASEEDSEAAWKVVINEALPNPTGSDETGEFIELYNPNSVEVLLEEYKIDDAEGGSRPYKLPSGTSISAKGYLAFDRPDSKITLNNDKDSVRFLSPDDEVIDEVSYDSVPKEGAAFARKSLGDWEWTTTSTPGEENIFSPIILATATAKTSSTAKTAKVKSVATSESETDSDEEEEESDEEEMGYLSGAAEDENYSDSEGGEEIASTPDETTVAGIVSAEPNSLQEKAMFIMNPGMGVLLSEGEFPELKIGDLVKVTGVMKESGLHKFLVVSSPENIQKTDENFSITPQKIVLGANNDYWVGSLVEVSGSVGEIAGRKFVLGGDNGRVIVNMPKIISEKDKVIKTGNLITVIGIFSKVNDDYQIFSRSDADVLLNESSKPLRFRTALPVARPKLIASIMFFLAAGLIYILLKPDATPRRRAIAQKNW